MKRYMGDDVKPVKSVTLEEINRRAKVEKEKQERSKEVVENSADLDSVQIEKKKKKRKLNADDTETKKHLNEEGEESSINVSNGVPNKTRKLENNEESSTVIPKRHRQRINEKLRLQRKKEALKNSTTQVEDTHFTIIGKDLETSIQATKRVLPEWLTNPEVISSDLHKKLISVNEIIGLNPLIISPLEKNGITHFFPVQSCVIPWLLKNSNRSMYRPQDLCVSSPTGSGKTLAYVLPIINALIGRIICNIKAIIVLPVRDLALQVFKVFQSFCAGTGLKVGLANGEESFGIEQTHLIRKGYRQHHSLVDILVCTPGRLVDHINETEGFSLKELRFLVIDEADRMMQQIKQGWLTHVEKCIYGNEEMDNLPLVVSNLDKIRTMPQKLLFSATLSHNPEKLQLMKLFQPKLFTAVIEAEESNSNEKFHDISDDYIGKYTTPKELTENYVVSSTAMKPLIMLHMIHSLKYRSVLIFTNSLKSTHRLFLLLNAFGGVKVKELSSHLHIRKRKITIRQFSQGTVDVLVCSDAMARGMDIENVRYVISYDKPLFLKTYIHRVGRTARAGRPGTAITILQNHEVSELKKMMADAKQSQMTEMVVNADDLQPLENDYKAVLGKLAESVAKESGKGKFNSSRASR